MSNVLIGSLRLLVVCELLMGCSNTTQQCAPPSKLPAQLMAELPSLREVVSADDLMEAHKHNMKACAVARVRYYRLIEAIEARESRE